MNKQIPDTIRDKHPGFADVQVGSSGELREKAQAHCLKNAHRTFEQGIQCVQVNSMNALVSLQDTVMVIHSPLGCSGCASFGAIDRLNVYKHHRGRDGADHPRLLGRKAHQRQHHRSRQYAQDQRSGHFAATSLSSGLPTSMLMLLMNLGRYFDRM